jgi:hypothetical protein
LVQSNLLHFNEYSNFNDLRTLYLTRALHDDRAMRLGKDCKAELSELKVSGHKKHYGSAQELGDFFRSMSPTFEILDINYVENGILKFYAYVRFSRMYMAEFALAYCGLH